MMNFNKVVLTDTGSVDINASVKAYEAALTEWTEINEIDPNIIEAAVNKVFDRFPKSRVSTPQLVSSVVVEISSDPAKYSALQSRVHAFVKGQVKLGTISSVKGMNGGLSRIESK